MKTKPILIIAAVAVVLAAGIFFFFHSKKGYKADQSEIAQFVTSFNNQVKARNADSVITYFAKNSKLKAFKKLVDLLVGKNGLDVKKAPLFSLALNDANFDIKFLTASTVEADIPVTFTQNAIGERGTTLTLKIRKVSAHKYKIVQVDARRFLYDYGAYEAMVKDHIDANKDTFAAITVAAFKTAAQLKSRYDTVVFFAHLDNKTWYYVAKGKFDQPRGPFYGADSDKRSNNMGLLNPDLKEIIPPQYDFIHNINGTFDGMIEVEKGDKRGLYNLTGKLVVPVDYEQIFPIDDEANLAVLRKGSDYFYLKKDTTISEKANLKIGDFFSKIRGIGGSLSFKKNALAAITEYNSTDEAGAVFMPPSYLVDLNLAPKTEDYENPLRQSEYDNVTKGYEVSSDEKVNQNWFQAAFYSIRDYFLGGRSEFYDRRNIVIIDKRTDRIFTTDIGTDYTPDGSGSLGGTCDVNSIKQLNDTLFEVKSGAALYVQMYDTTKELDGGPYYHYLVLRGNKLEELKNSRVFGFTKYVKMDDSYLEGCYVMSDGTGANKTINHITPEMLRWMKNEIYADYRYKFKDKRWQEVFQEMDSYSVFDRSGPEAKQLPPNENVDDSLTVIDKYNINWIVQKLNGSKAKPTSLASR